MTLTELRKTLTRALARLVAFRRHIRTNLVTGLVLVIPLVVTVFILRFIWEFLYNFLLPLFNLAEGQVPLLAGVTLQASIVLILVGFLYFLGWSVRTMAGGQVVKHWHGVIESIPVVRSFYRVVRQVVDMFSNSNPLAGKPVVVLEYPRIGTLALGMTTSRFIMPDGDEYLTVYIPTIPIPTSGFMALVKEDQVTPTDITFEEVMRIILSGGVLSEEITREHFERRRDLEHAGKLSEEQTLEPDQAMLD